MIQYLNNRIQQLKMSDPIVLNIPVSCDQNTELLPFFSSCIQRAKNIKKNIFASVTFESNYSDPLAVIEQTYSPSQSICYFEKPMDEFSVASSGKLVSGKFNGSKRFKKAQKWSEELFSRILVAGDHKIEGSGPTIFLNATFEHSSESTIFPALQTFLPVWQVLRKGGSHLITINTEVHPHSIKNNLVKNVQKILKKFNNLHEQRPIEKTSTNFKLSEPDEEGNYVDSVREALSEISNGNISKIVLARKLTYKTEHKLSQFSIAHALRNKFPDCYTFCMSTPNNDIFIGATPEILSRVSGTSISTEAVAGTAPRGPSAGKDAHLGKTLLGSQKEVREHRLVIDSILRRLNSCGITDTKEGQTRLLRLANLQHARTPLQAKLPIGVHPFDALSALHPTPAMGGSPREKALPLVKKLEGFSRGWYSGIAGWFDSRGRGEFMVPIRCGNISPNELTLYAGAGIVEGSIPSLEKAETDWKLEAMLDVITGRSNLSNQ